MVDLRTVQEQPVHSYYHPMFDHENKHSNKL